MSNSFLITSVGRTATKWLAWVMNHSEKWTVSHEPIKLSYDDYHGAVSPPHLLQMVRGRPIPIYHKLGVIIRDPVAQGISVQNRARVQKAPCEKLYIENAKAYFEILRKMIEKHYAIPIIYEHFADQEYVASILRYFDINDVKVTKEMIDTKKNTLKRYPFTKLAGDMRKAVHKYAIPFDEWVRREWLGESDL